MPPSLPEHPLLNPENVLLVLNGLLLIILGKYLLFINRSSRDRRLFLLEMIVYFGLLFGMAGIGPLTQIAKPQPLIQVSIVVTAFFVFYVVVELTTGVIRGIG